MEIRKHIDATKSKGGVKWVVRIIGMQSIIFPLASQPDEMLWLLSGKCIVY